MRSTWRPKRLARATFLLWEQLPAAVLSGLSGVEGSEGGKIFILREVMCERIENIGGKNATSAFMIRTKGVAHGHYFHNIRRRHARDSPWWNSRLQEKSVGNEGKRIRSVFCSYTLIAS